MATPQLESLSLARLELALPLEISFPALSLAAQSPQAGLLKVLALEPM